MGGWWTWGPMPFQRKRKSHICEMTLRVEAVLPMHLIPMFIGAHSSFIPNSCPSLSAPDAHAFIHRRATGSTGSPPFTNLSNHSPRPACNYRAASPDRIRREHSAVQDLDIVLDDDHVPDGAVGANVDITLDLRRSNVRVGPNVDIIRNPQHEVGHDLLWLAAIGIRDRSETRRRMECTAGADEDIASKVDRGLVRAGRLLVALLRRGFGLRRTHEVAADHHVVLYHAFPGQDDMPWAEDAGFATDFVACFLPHV